MRRKPAVRLASSDEILFYPNGDFDSDALVDLLYDASRRDVHPFKKILITTKKRDLRLNEWGYDGAYVFSVERVRHYELLQMWKSLPMASCYKRFSPDAEDKRSYEFGEAIRKRATISSAMQNFMSAYGKSLIG